MLDKVVAKAFFKAGGYFQKALGPRAEKQISKVLNHSPLLRQQAEMVEWPIQMDLNEKAIAELGEH